MASRLSLRDPVNALQQDIVVLLDESAARLSNDQLALADRIHDTRKALKRARSLALLLPAPLAREVDTALRDVHRRLGAQRDRDATLEAIARLLPLARGGTRVALQRLREACAAQSAVDDDVALPDVARDLGRLARAIGDKPIGGDFRVVVDGLEAVARRSRKGLRRALRSGDAHDFHRWRKWMKYYSFHLRYVAPLWPELLRVEANAAGHAAEWLGENQDLELVRAAIARSTLDDASAGALQSLVDREQARLQRKAASIGLHLHAQSPAAFARRLEGYWRARAHAAGPKDGGG